MERRASIVYTGHHDLLVRHTIATLRTVEVTTDDHIRIVNGGMLAPAFTIVVRATTLYLVEGSIIVNV